MRKFLLSLTLGITVIAYVQAQSTTHFELTQALISNNTRCISQDSDGNIWVGTTAGITRYDGFSWTSFTTEDGLGNNLIYDIYCSSDGDVWAATAGGISVYDGSNWTIYNLGSGLPSNTVWCISGDAAGNIWGGTSNAGAFKFDGSVFTIFSTSQGLISNAVKTIYGDRYGNVWMGTASGLSKYDGESFRSFTTANGLGGNLINDITQLSNGSIAVATNGGLSQYNFATWHTITTAQGLPNNNVLCVSENDENILYLGSSLGLFEYESPASYHLYTISDGLTANVVTSVFIDQSGSVWAGSPFSGLTRYNRGNQSLITRFNKDIVDNHVNHIYRDNQGKFWIATNAGLNCVDDYKWRTYTSTEGLVSNEITCTYKDANNVVWIGTTAGITRMEGTTMTQITTSNGLTHDHVNAITSDASGLIYVATDEKVSVIQGSAVIDEISTDDGLASNLIYMVFYDIDGRLWILCDGGITYREGDTFYDADVLPAFPVGRPVSIANNPLGGVMIGSDENLYFYQNGTTGASAVVHPLAATNQAINSMSSLSGLIYCSFESGELYSYNLSSWTSIAVANPVSYCYFDPWGYTWIGYQEDGLDKICRTCNTNLTYTLSAFACGSGNTPVTTLTITSPAGVIYTVNGGIENSNNPVFNNLVPSAYHLRVYNAGAYIADSIIFIEGHGGIETYLTLGQIDCNGNNNGWIEMHDLPSPGSFIWNTGNNSQLLMENLVPDMYQVTVSDNIGCTKIIQNTIQQPNVLQVGITSTQVLCYGNATGSITLSPTGGTPPYSIEWSDSYTGFSLTNLPAGMYAYTVTDINGCEASGNVTITQPAAALQLSGTGEAVACYGDTGDITTSVTGGTLPYTYHWNDNFSGANRTNMPAGTYYLTVSDVNNCSTTGSWQITQPIAALEISDVDEVDVYCFGNSSGSIDVTIEGGTSPYEYSWTKNSVFYSTDEDLENLSIGVYQLVVTDDHGCADGVSVTISQSPPLQLDIDATPITCPGYANGVLYADVSGGSETYSSFYWYNSQNQVVSVDQTFEDVAPGYYFLSVTDSYYCTITDEVTVTEGDGHDITLQITDATCYGAASGSIHVVVDGGATTDVDYAWAAGVAGNTATATNLEAGEYFVTITDNEGCETSANGIVNQPPMADLGAFPANGEFRFCSGDQLLLDAGDGFTSYLWSTGSQNQTIPVNNGGSYSVLVHNSTGCILGDTATVVVGEVFQDEELNLASVNEQNKVTLYWQKTPDVGTDHYNIYRKSGSQYVLYDDLDADLPAIYVDENSNASENTFSYKISSVDTCGNESALSDAHSSMYLLAQSEEYNQQVVCTLSYTPYEGFFVVYYYILKGTSPDNLEVADQNLYNEFEYIEFNPNPEGTYYQIMVRRLDGCYPGDGNYYDTAYSNIVFCQPYNGIANRNIDNQVTVYPTIFDDYISLNFNLQQASDVSFYFINSLGQAIVLEEKHRVDVGNQQIDLHPNLAPGMYMLKMKIGNEWITRKVIKN
ncbi:MAG TPA: two-component regulator propeller domain-containing protein [Bacteroidales bacterium]|nr:two-component regulator propeller domain-containing protein [Bacteroidales bacterium]